MSLISATNLTVWRRPGLPRRAQANAGRPAWCDRLGRTLLVAVIWWAAAASPSRAQDTAYYVLPPPRHASSWVTASGTPCVNGPDVVPGEHACEWKPCKEDPFPAVVYYVCDTGGDDSRSPARARHPDTPWATVARAVKQFYHLAPGEAVALCRGGTFVGGGTWRNDRGDPLRPFVVRDYTRPGRARAGDPRPILMGKLDDFITPGNVKFENLAVHGNGVGDLAFTYKKVNDVTLCNLELARGEIGVQLASGGDPRAVSRVRVIGTRFIENSDQGFLGSGIQVELRDGYFYGNGSKNSPLEHAIYMSGDSYDHPDWLSDGEVISDNEIHPPARANQAALVMHGIHVNVTIEYNRLLHDTGGKPTPAGWGFAIGGAGYAPRLEYVENATMRGNIVLNAGNLGLGIATCRSNCLIENNLVVNTQQPSIGIGAPGEPARNSDPVSRSITVRNNTVYLTAAGSTGIRSGIEGQGYVVVNNAVDVNGVCFAWEGPSNAYLLRDYNVSSRCSDRPLGPHSRSGNPKWMSPGNLRPAPDSPLIRAGHPMQRPQADITGEARGTPPSIGAYDR